MHRMLERLDSAASTIVPLAYLVGLMAGTAAYFTGVTLDMGLAVGIALAVAAECHAFLEQRRVRALFASYSRTQDEDVREHSMRQLRTHMAILAALVLFSTYNSVAFVAATFHPIPGFLPGWLQVGIRGSVIPALFLLTGGLSPLSVSASDELAAASHHMLRRTIKATVRQWNGRIDRARKSGVDLAPVAVALMQDAGDIDGARRVELIAQGLALAEAQRNVPRISAAYTEAIAPEPEPEPPTPTPDKPRTRRNVPHTAREQSPVLLLASDRPRRVDSGRKSIDAHARWLRETDAAADILTTEPTISTRELARRLHVRPERATAIRRTVQPERPTPEQVAADIQATQAEGQVSA